MKPRPRKGLEDIRSVVNLSGEEKNPQRKFLRLATLELRKTLCNTVKEAARRRLAEMDQQLAEIEEEQARMLEAIQAEPGVPGQIAVLDTAPHQPAPSGRFRLKY
jgi:DNA-binding transcriptional MerR regulator